MSKKKEPKAPKAVKAPKAKRARKVDPKGFVTYPVRLTAEQWHAVEEISDEQKLSFATVIRTAVATFTGTKDPTVKRGRVAA